MKGASKRKHKIDRRNEKLSYSKINTTWLYVVTYALEWIEGPRKKA